MCKFFKMDMLNNIIVWPQYSKKIPKEMLKILSRYGR